MAAHRSTKKLDEIVSERIGPLKGTFFPNFKVDCDGRPYHAGTLTIMSIGGVQLLVTARHVLDRDLGNECDSEDNQLVAVGSRGPVDLHPFKFSVIFSPGDGFDVDLAILEPRTLDTESLAIEPVHSSLVHRQALHGGLYMAACGFPSSKNFTWAGKVTRRPYSYFGLVANDSVVRSAGYDPQHYFAIRIDLKRVFRGSEKRVRAPDPSGISGGPVFIAHDFRNRTSRLPSFAGIVVARDRMKRHLICVRAGFIDVVAKEIEATRLP